MFRPTLMFSRMNNYPMPLSKVDTHKIKYVIDSGKMEAILETEEFTLYELAGKVFLVEKINPEFQWSNQYYMLDVRSFSQAEKYLSGTDHDCCLDTQAIRFPHNIPEDQYDA